MTERRRPADGAGRPMAGSPLAGLRSPTAPPISRATRQSMLERIMSLPNDLIMAFMESYMSALSPEALQVLSMACAVLLNVILIAVVFFDLELERQTQRGLRLEQPTVSRVAMCVMLMFISLCNAASIALSSRNYSATQRADRVGFGTPSVHTPRQRFFSVWDPSPAQMLLFCWFSPPHVLAISISHDMWALICNIWVAAATSFTLTCLDYMYKRHAKQERYLHGCVLQEVERAVRTPPVVSHYCSSILRGGGVGGERGTGEHSTNATPTGPMRAQQQSAPMSSAPRATRKSPFSGAKSAANF